VCLKVVTTQKKKSKKSRKRKPHENGCYDLRARITVPICG
jgi:hypothetical protein